MTGLSVDAPLSFKEFVMREPLPLATVFREVFTLLKDRNATEDRDLAIALGLAASGVLGLAAISNANSPPVDQRKAFLGRLRERLSPLGIEIVSADLGRNAGAAVWVLAIVFPNQTVVTVHAPVTGDDVYSASTADDVSVRVMQYVRRELSKVPPGA